MIVLGCVDRRWNLVFGVDIFVDSGVCVGLIKIIGGENFRGALFLFF